MSSALAYVSKGYFGQVPETIQQKTAHLMRLLAAEHPFVDGNKRTALATVATFYATNGSAFAYDHRVRTIPKRFATDESSVETEAVVEYCRENTRIEPGDRSNSESVVWREKSV